MRTRPFIALLTAASLSACVSILPEPAPAPSVYRLVSSAQPADKLANAELIRVDRPSANQIFNSSDIVVSQNSKKLSAVAQAKWSEVTPIVIQNAMVDALESSPEFIGLIPTSGARSKTRLHLTIKNFEADFDNGLENAPVAIVHYRVIYTRADDRSLLGTHSVRKTMRAKSIEVPSLVEALETANAAAMTDIVAWLEAQRRDSDS